MIETLSNMLSDRVVVTEEELRVKAIRAALRTLGLDTMRLNEKNLKEILYSFLECPITVKSLHFPERVELSGVNFYHLHTTIPSSNEFLHAYEEYLQARDFLTHLNNFFKIFDKFFESYRREGEFLRVYSKRYPYAIFFSTIRDAFEDASVHINLASKFEGEYIVAVKTGEKIEHFFKFFKFHSESFKKANVKVWVVNPEKFTVDPFIGYPKDLSLISKFKNPRLATQIESVWRVKIDEID